MLDNVPFDQKYEIDEAMSPIQFIANVGGLMGLFMGFSFVSAVEVFYHICSYFGSKFLNFGRSGGRDNAIRAYGGRRGSSYSRVHVMSRPTSAAAAATALKVDRPPSIIVKSVVVPKFEKKSARNLSF